MHITNLGRKERKQKDRLVRTNRKEILLPILSPLQIELSPELYEKVVFIYGSEAFMVLKDIWQLDNEKIISLSQWIAKAVINQARLELLELPSKPSE